MPTFTAHQLTETVTRIFSAAGTPPAKARTVAELLIDANLTGHDSHGVIRVPQYLDSMAKGEIDPDAGVEVLREGSATALLDGHWDFGQVTMTRAVEVVLEKARPMDWERWPCGAPTTSGVSAATSTASRVTT